MSDCVVELPQEVSVKASQRFEDLELARRSQAGDTEAFGELVTKYRAKIFTMICSIVGNESGAWNLAQEGFLKRGDRSTAFRVDRRSIRGCTLSRLTHFASDAVAAR